MMPIRTTLAASLLAASLAFAGSPGQADGNAGAYLAARIAATENDYRSAAGYFTQALLLDPSNLGLMEGALSSYISAGDMERAVPVATRIIQSSPTSQLANLVLIAKDAKDGDWEALLANLDAGQTVGPLFDGLVRAWALVGAGRMNDALAAFDEVAENPGVGAFGLYHKALALASVGRLRGRGRHVLGRGGAADAADAAGRHRLCAGAVADRSGRRRVEVIDRTFGSDLDAAMADLRRQLAAGAPVPYGGITSAREGVAESAFSIAGALNGEAADAYTLIYARVAQDLDPEHVDALLLVASLLNQLRPVRSRVARPSGRCPADHPFFHIAELGRAEAVAERGRRRRRHRDPHGAVREAGRRSRRSMSRWATCCAARSASPRRRRPTTAPSPFWARPDRGRMGRLLLPRDHARARGPLARGRVRLPNGAGAPARPAAGAELPRLFDGRDAGEPRRGAGMIERAVAAEPQSGYIVDSLGWVLYRLGRYEEALGHMERAVELLPVDPVVNDHLGDVYWAVGRKREAEFQWHRALSFVGMGDSTDADPDRIRRKLEIGLDAVLAEEGAPPLRVADDNG
jgi:tetratricopeptide (TPR) repeat protein